MRFALLTSVLASSAAWSDPQLPLGLEDANTLRALLAPGTLVVRPYDLTCYRIRSGGTVLKQFTFYPSHGC